MSSKETLERAYGNIPKEVGLPMVLDWIPSYRGMRYYWLKFMRTFTR